MTSSRRIAAFTALATCLAVAPSGPAQPPATGPVRERFIPVIPNNRAEPVAETRLLMDGIHRANFDGLGRILAEKPTETEAWAFARGQALLIAEGSNLLTLRPPQDDQARTEWTARTADLKVSAITVAKAASQKDYPAARAAMADLANSCNRCHQAFGETTRMVPFVAAE